MSEIDGAAFLHRRNQDFHNSESVTHVVAYLNQGPETIPNEPAAKIAAYLGFLADINYVNDGLLTGEEFSMDRQLDELLVKPKDVEGQTEKVISDSRYDQKDSLQVWADYLTDSGYPNWFKKYAFEGMTTLGLYDKNKQHYAKRSKSSLSPFAELNPVALQNVYETIQTSYDSSFKKLYSAAIDAETSRQISSGDPADGVWTIHKQESVYVDAADELALSLQGHNTGWCTNAHLSARGYLKDGVMHVFRTKDTTGEYVVPRITIYISGNGEEDEVRGIDAAQEIEADCIDTATVRLETLPQLEIFVNRALNARRVLALKQRVAEGGILSVKDRIWLRHDESTTFALEDATVNALVADTSGDSDLVEAMLSGDPDLVNYARANAGRNIGRLLHGDPAQKKMVDALIASSSESAVAIVKSNILMHGSNVDKLALARALMGSMDGQRNLAAHLHLFESGHVDQTALAEGLMQQDPGFLVKNMQEFAPGSIDQAKLATIQLNGDWLDIKTLVDNIEWFDEGVVDPIVLYQRMIECNDYMGIYYNQHIFPEGLLKVGELITAIEAYMPQAFEKSQLSQPQLNELRAAQSFSDLSPKQCEDFERLTASAPPF